MIHEALKRNLQGHGIGRHEKDEIYTLAISDIQTLGVVLGDKPFVMGNEPTLVDATVYAFLANALVTGVDSPLKAEIEKNPVFQAYVDRMTARFLLNKWFIKFFTAHFLMNISSICVIYSDCLQGYDS
ncbi:MAG: hypothetical protein COB59_10920 [Rhodospirillaceae bacterium]|nr:MAG: hypothetical protein COB59_10920 [Rhodospirillaceae bacterium]